MSIAEVMPVQPAPSWLIHSACASIQFDTCSASSWFEKTTAGGELPTVATSKTIASDLPFSGVGSAVPGAPTGAPPPGTTDAVLNPSRSKNPSSIARWSTSTQPSASATIVCTGTGPQLPTGIGDG